MKKLVSIVLTIAIILSMSIVTFAAETSEDDECPEAGKIYVEVETRAVDTNTMPIGARPARKEDMEAAEQMNHKLMITSQPVSQRATWTYLPNYYVYNQTTSYNCGPACIQAALKYLTGSAPSQSTVASGCNTTGITGTYIADMVAYINTQQSQNTYESRYNLSSYSMKSALYSGIMTYDAPPIIGMYFYQEDGWDYSSTRHYMSVYGTMSDKSKFALADPWIGYANSGLSDRKSVV